MKRSSYAPNTPHVHLKAILSFAHEKFWSSIPARDDHVGHEDIVIAPVEHVLGYSSGQTKVGDLEQTFVIQEDICGLQISVNDVVLVVVLRCKYGVFWQQWKACNLHGACTPPLPAIARDKA
jgi:hypothetical protein